MRYNFLVAANANPYLIDTTFPDATDLQVDSQGDLVMTTAAGQSIQPPPVAYQQVGTSTVAVVSRYVVSGNTVTFSLGAYDQTKRLIIDPTFTAATYLGGSGNDDTISGNGFFPYLNQSSSNVAAGSLGDLYVTGQSASPNYPTNLGALQSTNGGMNDVVVTKLNPLGTSLVWSTYLGGTQDDAGVSLALDSSSNVYVTGYTKSNNFPTVAPIQAAPHAGGGAVFVTEIGTAGSGLVYSTYLGGSTGAGNFFLLGTDSGTSITVDGAGNAYVTGLTADAAFPTTAGALHTTPQGGPFLLKIKPNGTGLAFSTFFGAFFGGTPPGSLWPRTTIPSWWETRSAVAAILPLPQCTTRPRIMRP